MRGCPALAHEVVALGVGREAPMLTPPLHNRRRSHPQPAGERHSPVGRPPARKVLATALRRQSRASAGSR